MLANLKSPFRVTLARADLLRPRPKREVVHDEVFCRFGRRRRNSRSRRAGVWPTASPPIRACWPRPAVLTTTSCARSATSSTVPVSAEVVATEAPTMLEEGQKLARLHPQIVVKCPVTIEGLKATKALSSRGIRVNVTLIFSPLQGWRPPNAARASFHRSSDASTISARTALPWSISWCGFCATTTTRPRCWSPRSARPSHLLRAAEVGAHVATLPFERDQADRQASADRPRPREFPRRLAQDQAEDLICWSIRSGAASCAHSIGPVGLGPEPAARATY